MKSTHLALCSICFLLMLGTLHAQGTTGGRQTGSTGQTGGASTSGLGSAASTGGGSTGQNGGLGGEGLGESALQNSGGLPAPQFNTGDGSLGSQVGQNGFIGRSANTDRFIGSQFAGQGTGGVQQNNFSALGAGRNTGGTSQQSMTQRLIRPRLRIAFDAPIEPVEVVQERVIQNLTTIPLPGVNNVQITLNEEGVATLAGVVETQHERKLLEAIVRLEPGVRNIDNQLTSIEPVRE